MKSLSPFSILLTCLSMGFNIAKADNGSYDDATFFPTMDYCGDNQGDCSERVWIFPPMYIDFVCRYDFRQNYSQPNLYFWPNASSAIIRGTFGSFLDHVTTSIPQIGSNPRVIETTSGSYWLQGGEGRPGWEIPPCNTNRTQGVVHLPYLTVVLDPATADEDLYHAGVSYTEIAPYLNHAVIQDIVEQYVCDDLERVHIGMDRSQYIQFFPEPEEICPRKKSDSDDDLALYLGVSLGVLVFGIAMCVLVYRVVGARRRQASKLSSNPPETAIVANRNDNV